MLLPTSQSPLLLSVAERSFVRDGIRADCRVDGRQRHQVRRRAIRTGVFALSHGSARIETVSCSVKAELATNPEIIIEEGKRRLSFLEDCLLRYVDLTIVQDQIYWKLSMDVEHHDDECSSSIEQTAQCIRFAMMDTVLPVVHRIETNESSAGSSTLLDTIQLVPDETRPLVSKESPLPQFITIYETDEHQYFLDADRQEREIASATTHLWMDENNNIVACLGNPQAVASMAHQAVAAIREQYQSEDSAGTLLIQ